jgi:arsenate reductase (thioredoxin)
MRKVLFASAHNSGGSQMAAAFFNAFCAPALVKAASVLPKSADRVPGEVDEAMREIGFDLSVARPQPLTPELVRSADLLVCLGSAELCPSVPGQRRIDWKLEEPRSWSREHLRSLRDELRARVWRLVAKEGWYKLQPSSALRSSALQPSL